MSFSSRNPADLELNKPYHFTRDINGYAYTMTLVGEHEEYITTQETQWLGRRTNDPKSRVWEFNCEYPNGSNEIQWVWEKTISGETHAVEFVRHDGVWMLAE